MGFDCIVLALQYTLKSIKHKAILYLLPLLRFRVFVIGVNIGMSEEWLIINEARLNALSDAQCAPPINGGEILRVDLKPKIK